MSGIAGIIHFDGAPIEPGLIEKMTTAIAHRGPDGIRHWVDGSVALGQCMLRTTPESLEEQQPLANEDGSLILVMDGRVDNWEELRRELLSRDAVLRDRSDAELVLRAYQLWGQDCLAHIDGDFALVIWDARRREAFCARDRMGNKPFNYHWNGKTLVFASELSAILALPWVPQETNQGMLAEHLAWEWYSSEETLWTGVLRLLASHRMTVGSAGPRPELYWEPDLWETLPFTSDQDYIDHYRELFTDSVRRMSRSHRPLAIEVSGGLDSSAVFCMAEHLRRANRLPAPGIEGYTLAFTDDSGANEISYARAVGEHLGLPIREVPPSHLPLSWYADCARRDRDFPGFPNASMFLEIRRQAFGNGSRVVLTGEGGDEFLQGTRLYYAEDLARGRLSRVGESLVQDVTAAGVARAVGWFMRYGLLPLLPTRVEAAIYREVRRVRGGDPRHLRWLSPEIRKIVLERRASEDRRNSRHVRDIGQKQIIDPGPFADQVLERAERLAAQSGIELRYPMRTHRMLQFAVSIPERLRLRGNRSKFIHVQALLDVLPKLLLERTSKADFSVVFRQHLDRMQEALTQTLPRDRPEWVARDGMADLYRAYMNNPQAGRPLWTLWGLYWCDRVVP